MIQYVPHEDAPVVWGKIVGWVETEHGTPLRQEFFDEDNEKIRTIHYADVREVDGRRVPHDWRVIPHDKEGYGTAIVIHDFRFDTTFDDDIFTTRNLKHRK